MSERRFIRLFDMSHFHAFIEIVVRHSNRPKFPRTWNRHTTPAQVRISNSDFRLGHSEVNMSEKTFAKQLREYANTMITSVMMCAMIMIYFSRAFVSEPRCTYRRPNASVAFVRVFHLSHNACAKVTSNHTDTKPKKMHVAFVRDAHSLRTSAVFVTRTTLCCG